jgi:hypothetical protein
MTAPRVELIEELLHEAGSALHQRVWPQATGAQRRAERAEYFADAVRFALAHPASMHRLHAATARLDRLATPAALLPALLSGAMELAAADLGDVHLLDPTSGTLRLVAHAGFPADFVARSSVVDDLSTAYGRAVAWDRQVMVSDVEDDEPFAPHRSSAAVQGFRSVLSTPLRDYQGRVVGVVSVHWRRRTNPSPRELRLLVLFADYTGERLAGLLTIASGGTPATSVIGPVARAMVDALLDPPPSLAPPVGRGAVDVPTARATAFAGVLPADPVAELADLVVTGLFTAELELDAARSLVADGPVASRIDAATSALEDLVAQVRQTVIAPRRAEDGGSARGSRSPSSR